MVTMEDYEGWLMRYADGALTRDERVAVEAFLAQHPELLEELEEVSAVKVTPVVATLPGKENLLKEERKPFAWQRVAAAVALLVVAGTTLLLLNRQGEGQPLLAENRGGEKIGMTEAIDTIEAIETIEPKSIPSIQSIKSIPSIQPIPSPEPSLLAEEASPLPQAAPEDALRTEDSVAPQSLPEPSVTVAPVIENARLAVNPWLEALTASK